jgi:MFS family permease
MFSLSRRAAWQAAFTVYAVLAVVGALIAWKKVPETRRCSSVSVESGDSISRRLLTLLVIVFTTGVSTAMISPIYLIYVQDKFTTNVAVLAWAFLPAGILYSFLPSRLGKLSDRLGRAVPMAMGLGLAGLLSALLPKLPSIPWLVTLYTLSSVGWAMADPAEAAMVAYLTGEERRGRAYGLYKFTESLGAAFGPLLGGWLYDAVGQAVPFYVNGIVLFASAIWILLLLRIR